MANGGFMHVEFMATLDDMVEVSLRTLDRSKLTSNWRWVGGVFPGALVAVIVFLLVPGPLEWQLGASISGLLVSMAIYAVFHVSGLKTRLRRYYRQQLGIKKPFLV